MRSQRSCIQRIDRNVLEHYYCQKTRKQTNIPVVFLNYLFKISGGPPGTFRKNKQHVVVSTFDNHEDTHFMRSSGAT